MNPLTFSIFATFRFVTGILVRSWASKFKAAWWNFLLWDVQQRRLSTEEGLRGIKAEQQSLLNQSARIINQSLGLIGGTAQIATGAGVCYGSGGTLCAFLGAPLMAHGANNVYENARSLYEGRSDVEGPVRKTYQKAAKQLGYTDSGGNMAYLAGDLAMPGIGMMRPVLKPDAWRLFRFMKTDRERAYMQMNRVALALEGGVDAVTAKQLYNEYNK